MPLVDDQKKFYGELYAQHGDDPRSLSWRDQQTQNERFARLAKLLERDAGKCSVHEIGCGLGHFGEYLRDHHAAAAYSGSDICTEFVESSRKRLPECDFFERDITDQLPALSGTFNPRLKTPTDQWQQFIHRMLKAMYNLCTKGIAVNFLTSFADAQFMQDYLHYQSEADIIDYTVRHLSRHYELDQAGPLFEFTLRVYRPQYVRSLYSDASYDKYFRNVSAGAEVSS